MAFVIVPTSWRERVSWEMASVDNSACPIGSLELGFGMTSRPFWDRALQCIEIYLIWQAITFPLPALKNEPFSP